jgi:hypothetical protein
MKGCFIQGDAYNSKQIEIELTTIEGPFFESISSFRGMPLDMVSS